MIKILLTVAALASPSHHHHASRLPPPDAANKAFEPLRQKQHAEAPKKRAHVKHLDTQQR